MSTEIKTVYKDVTITYREVQDDWLFTLRGRDKLATSVREAKAVIDMAPPKKKGKPFARFEAWSCGKYSYSKDDITELEEITVLSIGPGDDRVRARENNGAQGLHAAQCVFPKTDDNAAVVAEIERINNQIEALKKDRAKASRRLKSYTIPKEES